MCLGLGPALASQSRRFAYNGSLAEPLLGLVPLAVIYLGVPSQEEVTTSLFKILRSIELTLRICTLVRIVFLNTRPRAGR